MYVKKLYSNYWISFILTWANIWATCWTCTTCKTIVLRASRGELWFTWSCESLFSCNSMWFKCGHPWNFI